MNAREAARGRARLAWKQWVRTATPNPAEASLVAGSALLTILSFPNFDLWFLAWIGLTPLLLVVARVSSARRAFVAGWLWGTIFFYGTCWWLTYPMIHYGHIRSFFAYPLLLLPIIFVGLFPALFCLLLSRVIARFGIIAITIAPLIWVSCEWLRYVITGQLWNAIGYSQAFQPLLILPARWAGVYAISLIVVSANTALALIIFRRSRLTALVSALLILAPAFAVLGAFGQLMAEPVLGAASTTFVGAVQPNVPMDIAGSSASMDELLNRHVELSRQALKDAPTESYWTRVIIWPESPMNFSYSRDPHLRQVVGDFARANRTSVLLNSLEPARDGGDQNSAVMVNEQGQIAARYDKIRLMPFGEYVPLPQWLPGARSVRSIVGEFKPGSSYTLMPLGAIRAGVFICIEAAHPGIARSFTNEGANVLINISNDGYLGPTPVMRQHLANAIFRAVENDRPLARVTNTGITAFISSSGAVSDETGGFQKAIRTWTISRDNMGTTFYSRHGDVFVYGCALISLGFVSASLRRRRLGAHASGVLVTR